MPLVPGCNFRKTEGDTILPPSERCGNRFHRVALITGASGAIGSAIARHLARAGVYVVLGYYKGQREAAETLSHIKAEGGSGHMLQADLTSADETASLIRRVNDQWGGLHILVNNAGTALEKLLLDTEVDEWDATMALHVRAPYICAQQSLPAMIRQQFGRIINISSVWGQIGAANEVAYSTAKAALIGFTKALAKEVGSAGVTVNAVAPGVIKTRMLDGYDAADMDGLIAQTPVGRLGLPDDVARAVTFLAAEEAGYITGQVVGVNGGFVV